MINFTKELPQNTTVIQSEHTEQYLKSSNEQHHLEAVYDIRGATCISDAVFKADVAIITSRRCECEAISVSVKRKRYLTFPQYTIARLVLLTPIHSEDKVLK